MSEIHGQILAMLHKSTAANIKALNHPKMARIIAYAVQQHKGQISGFQAGNLSFTLFLDIPKEIDVGEAFTAITQEADCRFYTWVSSRGRPCLALYPGKVEETEFSISISTLEATQHAA